MKWLKKIYKENKAIVWAGGIAAVLSIGVLLKIKDEVTRFTLIMPLFAGFILFSILITADDELEDDQEKKPVKRDKKKKK